MTSDEIFKIQAFYSNLFKGYSILSEDEIRQSILDEEFRCKKISWSEFGKHIERMRNSLMASTLSSDQREIVLYSLTRQQEDYEMYQWKPEARMIMGEGDRESLVGRRYHLIMGNYQSDEREYWENLEAEGYISDWRSIPKRIIAEIEEKLKVLDDRLSTSVKAVNASTDISIAQKDQPSYLAHAAVTNTSDNFTSLFKLGFTIIHCNDLMKKAQVGANFNSPTFLNARIWALLDVLETYQLLDCSPIEAAPFAGKYFNAKMPKRPYGVRDSDKYREVVGKLTPQVKEDMANKKYGPNRA